VRCWNDQDWKRLNREVALFDDRASQDPWAVFTNSPLRVINVGPKVCASLRHDHLSLGVRSLHGDPLVVLAVAAELLAGLNGAQAECHGMQIARQFGSDLGLTAAASARAVRDYFANVYPAQPQAVRSTECRDGGALDIHPRSPVWP